MTNDQFLWRSSIVANVNLKALTGKLNTLSRKALENGLGVCVNRTNYNCEIEHWLLKLVEPSNGDVARIFKHFDVNTTHVNRDLTRAIDALKTGNARQPSLSQELIDWMTETWTLTSLELNAFRIRSGYLLAALLNDRT